MITTALVFGLVATPKVSAWVVGYNPESLKTFENRAKSLDTVFMEYYTIDKDSNAARRSAYSKTYQLARSIAKQNGVRFYVLMSNYATDATPEGFEATRMTKMLATAASRAKCVSQLKSMVIQDKADGIDLDLESLKATDKDNYSAFVAELSKSLRASKLLLSVTVHPKTEDKGNWDGPQAQDYKALGASADQFNVMTYDMHWADSDPGAIAGTEWVERVMNYTKTRVPAQKVHLGISCYGYDWSKKPATSIVWEDFAKRKYTVDESSGEYKDGKVFFSGAKAFRTKYDLAQRLGVGGVAFWYCGSEDPEIWDIVPRRK